MNKKVFSTIAAVTIGTIAASGLVLSPQTAFAGAGHEHAEGEKSCSGEKKCSGDKAHADGESKCSGEKKAAEGSEGDHSCGGSGCESNKK